MCCSLKRMACLFRFCLIAGYQRVIDTKGCCDKYWIILSTIRASMKKRAFPWWGGLFFAGAWKAHARKN